MGQRQLRSAAGGRHSRPRGTDRATQTRYPRIDLILPSDGNDQEFAGIIAGLIDRGLRISQKTVLDRLNLPTASATDATLHPVASHEAAAVHASNPADTANGN